MKKNIIRISAFIGVLILIYILYTIGPGKIFKNIRRVTVVNFLILFLMRSLYWILRTLNWKFVINSYGENLSLTKLVMARMSGHSVSQLTPASQVGSEATRIILAGATTKRISIASIILDKTIEFFAIISMTVFGVIAAFNHLKLPYKIKLFFISALLVFSALVLFMFLKQKKGILSWFINLLERLKLKFKFIEKNRKKIEETDEYVHEFYENHKSEFIKVFFLYILMILFWSAEVHMTIQFMGFDSISFIDSFIITTLGNIAFIFPFIPGSVGIYEATYIGLCSLVGINAEAAVSMVFIRRIIALLLAGFGLIGLWKLRHLRE